MLFNPSLTTAQILAAFAEQIAVHGGEITDTFDDGQRLFTRSVLPQVKEVRPGDGVQGGVALKATAEDICIYPYIFRLVCRNGAIMAETLEARSLGDLLPQDPDSALQQIREAIEACCASPVFTTSVRKMRTATQADADLALNLLPLLSRHSVAANPQMFSQIMELFFREGDRSRYGLANAITAVARDTRDPESRWDLEELGGGIAIGNEPTRPMNSGHAVAAPPRRLVSVG